MFKILLGFAIGAIVVIFFNIPDPNFRPTYGDTGLPKNCRAIIQQNIDAYRAREYTADAIMAALERNCGINGHSWGR